MGKKKAYAVTVGKRIGVFTRWLDVVPNIRVTGAAWEGFDDWASAQEAFDDSKRRGDTKIIDDPPKSSRRVYSSSTGRAGSCRSTTSDKTVRDALIREALEELKRERQQSGSKRGERDGREPSAAGCTTQARPPAAAPCSPSRELGLGSKPRPDRCPSRGGRDNASRRSEASTSSSPPTDVTQVEHGSDSGPRYTQSLSYGSDLSPMTRRHNQFVSPVTGSSALAFSDRRTYVSEPSTRVTKYFPADFATRPRDAYTMVKREEPRSPLRSPAMTVSEYATPPSLARTLPPGLSPVVKERPFAVPVRRSEAASSATSPPVMQRKMIGKSFSEASIQAECETTRSPRVRTQTKATEARQYATTETQTTPPSPVRRVPLRATVSEGDVLRDNCTREEVCGCERPEHVCRCCGLPATTRARQSVANNIPTSTAAVPVSPVLPTNAPYPAARSVTPTTRLRTSPVSVASPVARPAAKSPVSVASSPMSIWSPLASTQRTSSPTPSSRSVSPASFYSAVSLSEGHTPLLGASEQQPGFSPSLRGLLEGPDTWVGSAVTSARTCDAASPSKATAVVHDITFDPRSPLQRGTSIPAGSGHASLMRPSPTMAPLNSLLFS